MRIEYVILAAVIAIVALVALAPVLMPWARQ